MDRLALGEGVGPELRALMRTEFRFEPILIVMAGIFPGHFV